MKKAAAGAILVASSTHLATDLRRGEFGFNFKGKNIANGLFVLALLKTPKFFVLEFIKSHEVIFTSEVMLCIFGG